MVYKNSYFRLPSLAISWLCFLVISPLESLAEFVMLKPGLESNELKLQSGIFTSELTVVRVDPKLWDVKVYKSAEPRTAIEVCKITNCMAAINANFFGKDLQPLGLIITNFKLRHPVQLGGRILTGVFYRQKDQSRIIFRDKFQLSQDISEAIQAGPRLVSDGQAISIPEDTPTRRSAVAIDRKGRILLFASKDRFPGLSLLDLQKLLLSKELEIIEALNLDGGGSSQLYVSSEIPESRINLSGGDKVPVFLTVQEIK